MWPENVKCSGVCRNKTTHTVNCIVYRTVSVIQCFQDFQGTEEFSYFEDAKDVTISNCMKVVLEILDFYSTKLEQLHLRHIHSVVFNVLLPSTVSSLEIEDVGNLTGIPYHVFLHVRYLHNLMIKNTNVQFIDSHTFSDILMRNIQFINTTFKYLNSSSLNFTGMEDGLHNSVFHTERCTFEKLDLNAVSVQNIRTLQILDSEFKGILKDSTFKISRKTKTLLQSNIFTCSKREDTCDDMKIDIVENLYQFSRHNSQDMCKLLQVNYCRQRTESLINSLQHCYPKLLKYGVNESCTPIEPDKGHNFCLNIILTLICTLLLKVILW